MREARRQKAMDQIDSLEKALRNIGFLGAEILVTDGYISANEFLHELYHMIKRAGRKCDMCNKPVNSSVVFNKVRLCESCVRSRKLWLMIPDEDLIAAGWIV